MCLNSLVGEAPYSGKYRDEALRPKTPLSAAVWLRQTAAERGVLGCQAGCRPAWQPFRKSSGAQKQISTTCQAFKGSLKRLVGEAPYSGRCAGRSPAHLPGGKPGWLSKYIRQPAGDFETTPEIFEANLSVYFY